MRPPKTFAVGNRTFQLLFERDPSNEEGGKVWGILDPVGMTMVLDPDAQPRHMAELLLHELMHAVYADYWHSIRPKNDNEIEEFFVTVGANGVTKVFRDNPKLFSWYQYLMS